MRPYWDSLLGAVCSFAEQKQQSKSDAIEHTVSCIVFNSSARVEFSQRSLTSDLFSYISFSAGGGTNFSAALREVIKLLDKCMAQSLNVVIFMTDGDAAYPTAELNTLNEPEYQRKIDTFWGVLFGSGGDNTFKRLFGSGGDDTLKRITESMNAKGQYRNPKDVKDLVHEYVEIAKHTCIYLTSFSTLTIRLLFFFFALEFTLAFLFVFGIAASISIKIPSSYLSPFFSLSTPFIHYWW